jgi:hypothetical protein
VAARWPDFAPPSTGFLAKLIDEQRDFETSHCLSARHAINAVMTAHHLHEWVWGEFVELRRDLQELFCINARRERLSKDRGRKISDVSPCSAFFDYIQEQCFSFADARNLTNGAKHFEPGKVSTGKQQGAFQSDVFLQRNAFQTSYLWIVRDGQRQCAEDFIKELVDFWIGFFEQHSIP